MAQVTVSINGRDYRVACDDGQEAHLQSVAGYVDKTVNDLAAALGQVGDTRLLVMASLLIADQLSDARRQAAGRSNGQEAPHAGGQDAAPAETETAEAIESCAKRLEDIAARLEGA